MIVIWKNSSSFLNIVNSNCVQLIPNSDWSKLIFLAIHVTKRSTACFEDVLQEIENSSIHFFQLTNIRYKWREFINILETPRSDPEKLIIKIHLKKNSNKTKNIKSKNWSGLNLKMRYFGGFCNKNHDNYTSNLANNLTSSNKRRALNKHRNFSYALLLLTSDGPQINTKTFQTQIRISATF